MNRWLGFLFRPLLVAVACGGVLAPRLVAQVTVDDRISQLVDDVKKKSDDQASAIIDGFSKDFSAQSDEDKKKIVAALEKSLNAKRVDGDDKLFEAVVWAFSNMAELGEKATVKSLKVPTVDKRRGVLAAALRSLATHKNPGDVQTMIDYLVHNEPIVVAGAAEGLGEFGDQPEKIRKQIVGELVKNYASYYSATTNAQAQNKEIALAKEKLATVEKPFLGSLNKLTGQEFKDATAAQKWFNDNKSKKWAEPAAAPPQKN